MHESEESKEPDYSQSRMPGEIAQTPTYETSGYGSSNDDHFSDAPEAPEDEMLPVKSSDEQAPEPAIPPNHVSEPTAPPTALALDAPQAPTPDVHSPGSNHVPGAFELDDEGTSETKEIFAEVQKPSCVEHQENAASEADPEADVQTQDTVDTSTPQEASDEKQPLEAVPAVVIEDEDSPASELKLDLKDAPTEAPVEAPPADEPSSPVSDTVQVPSTIVTDVNGEVESNRLDSPDIVVKWNDQGERIPRKVRQEAGKIEQNMEAQKVRNRTPSPRAAPRRVISGGRSPDRSDLPLRDLSDTESTSVIETQTLSLADVDDMMPPPSPSLLPTPMSARLRRRSSAASRARSPSAHSLRPPISPRRPPSEHGGSVQGSDDGFGEDDFDDFGEAVEGEDFDDFEGFEEGDVNNDFADMPQEPPQVFLPEIPVPILDYSAPEAYRNGLSDAIDKMFPSDGGRKEPLCSVEPRPFLTERSLSLWNQLVAPPPLQPPNWKVSRIRRLFLVSLGVPVDLDEILPEKQQKKLVLPSSQVGRKSTDSRPSHSRSQSRAKKDKKDAIDPEKLDISSARILCSTTEAAMDNFTGLELLDHIQTLERTTEIASEVLTYWLKKRDSAVGDKETFETVIESLVGYARKKRQNG